ncbi:MAG: hypothetical protein JG718_11410 [Candidatus Thiothrix moscowensis]|nr:hypothetical protein [Candidatus Thiothrix moscowensis]
MQTITLRGELADWVTAQATKSVRTPEQQVEYLLLSLYRADQKRRQDAAERKANRQALRARQMLT